MISACILHKAWDPLLASDTKTLQAWSTHITMEIISLQDFLWTILSASLALEMKDNEEIELLSLPGRGRQHTEPIAERREICKPRGKSPEARAGVGDGTL